MRSPIFAFLDRRDDRKARILRQRLGPRGWLVSWHREEGSPAPKAPWLARVSCRDWPQTIERRASRRARALRDAVAALESLIAQSPRLPHD